MAPSQYLCRLHPVRPEMVTNSPIPAEEALVAVKGGVFRIEIDLFRVALAYPSIVPAPEES